MMDFAQMRDRALDELRQVLLIVDDAEAALLTQEVRRASRIFVAGAGRTGLSIRAYGMRLMHIGLTAHVVGDVTTPAIQKGDLLLAASGSGKTRGILQIAEAARVVGARIAAITSDRSSPLANMSDCCIVLPAATAKASPESKAGKVVSAQPLGSLFEQCLWVFGDIHIAAMKQELGESEESLSARHANLE